MFSSIFTIILNSILSSLDQIFTLIVIRLSPSWFCFFSNLKSFLLRRDIKFSTSSVFRSSFIASSGIYKRYFFAKKQNFISYSRGISHRGSSLASTYLLSNIDFSPGDTVIDCGANIGDLEIFFFANNIAVNYIGIEPSPSEYSCLQRNLLLSGSSCFNIAFYNRDSSLSFYVSSDFADSSLIMPPYFSDIIKVKCLTLSSFCSIHSINQIKLLKLEAEGAEPEILLGSLDFLKNIEFISADLGFERGIGQESSLPAVCNILLNNGFELIDFTNNRVVCLFRNLNL